jgi:SagB-type dehydrogenase family enzyme
LTNWDIDVARAYHERTKHSYESVRRSGHFLDWDNKPHPFKEYVRLEPIALPRELPRPDVAAMDALADGAQEPGALDLPQLARLLRWGAGVVRSRAVPGGEVYHFRTYSSAGALYPVEVYVACGRLPELSAGLYHFHPGEFALRRLRDADVRAPLANAAATPDLAEAGAVLVLSGILWRTAWKYQARGYRHLFWDAGTMLANLLALGWSARLAPRIVTGFVDRDVNDLLGVDGEREAALALFAVGRGEAAQRRGEAAQTPAELPSLDLEVAPLSREEVPYPEAHALHRASTLIDVEDVRRYRGSPIEEATAAVVASSSREPLETVLRRRGSVREFATDAVPSQELAAVLSRAMGPIPSDVAPSNRLSLIANAVEGVEPGSYDFTPPDRFVLGRPGRFRRQAGFLVLEQPLGALAAATHFFLADLDAVLARHGNRGYRSAQLEAGIRTGRVYLGAYALGFAATASTFYDDAVSEFLARKTAESPLLAVALGRTNVR